MEYVQKTMRISEFWIFGHNKMLYFMFLDISGGIYCNIESNKKPPTKV